jgi:acyl carrier protein phosphodiesterase
MMTAEMTYSIGVGDTHVYLSESPEDFINIVDTTYLNTWLVTKDELDTLVGYLALMYPNVSLESKFGSATFLKYVEIPK